MVHGQLKLILTGSCLVLSSCDNGAEGRGATSTAAGDASASGSSWTVRSEVDPMTDETVRRGEAVLRGNNVYAKAVITCTSDQVAYTLTIFDNQDAPAALVSDHGRVSAMVRLDKEAPLRFFHRPKFTNQFEMVDREARVPAAGAVAIRLYTTSGEEAVRIDQSNPVLKPMLARCAETVGATLARKKAVRDANAADQYARCGDHPCDIEPPPLEPTTPLGSAPATSGAAKLGAPPARQQTSKSEADLDQLAECQDQRDGRGTAGVRLDCSSILARHERDEEEIARRDFELEAGHNRDSNDN